MKKITDLPKISELQDTNVFLTDGVDGTKGILAHDLLSALFNLLTPDDIAELINMDEILTPISRSNADNLLIGTSSGNRKLDFYWGMFYLIDAMATVPLRRQCYRGKWLGNSVTSEQYARIADGTFKGMMLGDYWQINDVTWRIVDFDYWLGTGDKECTTHHLVIMPDYPLCDSQMNTDATSEGGYFGSYLRDTSNNPAGMYDAVAKIYNTFYGGGTILVHREFLTNAVAYGAPVGVVWTDSTVELPNEIMMYGCYIQTKRNSGNTNAYKNRGTIDNIQLAAMAAKPSLICPAKWTGASAGEPQYERYYQWLRDVVSDTDFACILPDGKSDHSDALCNYGVRPVFGLTG